MKLKILEKSNTFTPLYLNEVFNYYEFDRLKYKLKDVSKYKTFLTNAISPEEPAPASTSLDYTTWGYIYSNITDTDLNYLTGPSTGNPYKALVYMIRSPASTYYTGANWFRRHDELGYCGNISATGYTWGNFRQQIAKIPKSRRVFFGEYWQVDIDYYQYEYAEHYRATTDGTTYQGERYNTFWTDQAVQDSKSSFSAFLNTAKQDGISFDYVLVDNETTNKWMIDGYNSRSGSWGTSTQPHGGIIGFTANAKAISAWINDPRFTTYKHPDTNLSFADELMQNYFEIRQNDPTGIDSLSSAYNTTNLELFGLNAVSPKILTPGTDNTTYPYNFTKLWVQEDTGQYYFVSTSDDTNTVYRGPAISDSSYNSRNTDSSFNLLSSTDYQKLNVHPVVLAGITLTDVTKVVPLYKALLALKSNGQVVPWGEIYTDGSYPQLEGTTGDGTTLRPASPTGRRWATGLPVRIDGITLIASDIAGSSDRLCAIKASDGSLVCWGYEGANDGVPTITGTKSISAGLSHFLAVTSTNGVTCWGNNDYGQCDVPQNLTNVTQVSGGNRHSLALKSDGTVVAWGANTTDNDEATQTYNTNQATVPAGLTNVKQVVASQNNSFAVKTNGSIVMWGANYLTDVYGNDTGIIGTTLIDIASGQSVKVNGITLTGVSQIISPSYNNAINLHVPYQTTAQPVTWQSLLSPWIGNTGATAYRDISSYWAPYGCTADCICGFYGTYDRLKQYFKELNGYTYTTYTLNRHLIPAWMAVSENWVINKYVKEQLYDTLQTFPEYSGVKPLYYDHEPLSNEESFYTQDSNLRKLTHRHATTALSGRPWYWFTRANLMFTSYVNDLFTGTSPVSDTSGYRNAFNLRSGYLRGATLPEEKYMFYGYLDIQSPAHTKPDSPCSPVKDRFVRYPLTDIYGITGEPRTNYYQFQKEMVYKVFVYFMKNLRHYHRSYTDQTDVQFAPWIGMPDTAGYGKLDTEGVPTTGNIWPGDTEIDPQVVKITEAYWYEFNFHLCLHGPKLFQVFESGSVFQYLHYLRYHTQRFLDIWRIVSKNTRVKPCSNSTVVINTPVDRINIASAFDKYVLSCGKNMNTGEYIWRLTVPVHKFVNNTVTLKRVGSDSDLPETVVLDCMIDTPENRVGFWIKRKVNTTPEYTIE